MDKSSLSRLVEKQQVFFGSGQTLSVQFRLNALKRLKAEMLRRESDIEQALEKDLGKSRYEGYLCETGMVLAELTFMLRHTRKFAKRRRVRTPLTLFPASSFVEPSPLGNVLIMSPWNYPFLLTLEPLVDALAAGNTAIVKPSAYSPATGEVMRQIIEAVFTEEYVAVVTGGRQENACLMGLPFDHIFFTGSQAVGKEVLRHAAERLTPVTLELGGKSPCIVDETARLSQAARRIAFGKFLNCGQTCVAPDYVLCHKSVKAQLIELIRQQISEQFGADPLENPHYGKIVNQKHFDRLTGLVEASTVLIGGETQPERLRIAPTVVDCSGWDEPVMQQEIFGPILPVLAYEELDEAVAEINRHGKPLAAYVFSENPQNQRFVLSRCRFGGGCINDVVLHLATSFMGFGGVGESGMGAYHGEVGFQSFSHDKSILKQKSGPEIPARYQPYSDSHDKLVRRLME